MRALRLNSWKSSPVLEEVPDPVPGPGQVVVKIGGAGACHSDLHLMHDLDESVNPFWVPPFTLGHENAGWVHALGEGVSGLKIGDPVAVYGSWGCGHCTRCLAGMDTYCENPMDQPVAGGGGGLGLDGGMAEYLRVPNARFCVPLPRGLDPVHAAPLTDAALTPYHAVRRSLSKLQPGSHCVVIGVGGLGHMAVQILNAVCATSVIAVDTRQSALATAASYGAAHTVLANGEAEEQIKDATGGKGADVVLDFVGSDSTIELGVAVSRFLGDLTIVGIAGGTLNLGFFTVPYELSVQTIYWGSRPELVEVLNLASRGLITPKITQFSLDDAASAYLALAGGELQGRAVIVP